MRECFAEAIPYVDFFRKHTTREFMSAVVNGMRPPSAPVRPHSYRSLMQQCWEHSPEARPTFADVIVRLVPMQEHAENDDPEQREYFRTALITAASGGPAPHPYPQHAPATQQFKSFPEPHVPFNTLASELTDSPGNGCHALPAARLQPHPLSSSERTAEPAAAAAMAATTGTSSSVMSPSSGRSMSHRPMRRPRPSLEAMLSLSMPGGDAGATTESLLCDALAASSRSDDQAGRRACGSVAGSLMASFDGSVRASHQQRFAEDGEGSAGADGGDQFPSAPGLDADALTRCLNTCMLLNPAPNAEGFNDNLPSAEALIFSRRREVDAVRSLDQLLSDSPATNPQYFMEPRDR